MEPPPSSSDVEMEAAEPSPPAPAPAAAGSAWGMLSTARVLLEEGKPALALQAVLLAIRSQGGEHAVIQTLNCARELYRHRSQANPSADDLASLLAQCAIAEAHSTTDLSRAPENDPSMMLDGNDSCILAETGRKQVMLDAFADGSSFICLKCGGLFSSSRKDEHFAFWCGPV